MIRRGGYIQRLGARVTGTTATMVGTTGARNIGGIMRGEEHGTPMGSELVRPIRAQVSAKRAIAELADGVGMETILGHRHGGVRHRTKRGLEKTLCRRGMAKRRSEITRDESRFSKLQHHGH